MAPHLISRPAETPCGAPSLLFIHGAFAGAWCWDEHFLPWFAARGYDSHAIDLPGRLGRSDFERLQEFGIDDYRTAVLDAIDAFETPPIVIGHSMGGFLAWQAAERRTLPAMVLMAPVPPSGLAAPAIQLGMTNPHLFADVAAVHAGEAATEETLHATLFSESEPTNLANKYLKKFQPESRMAVTGMYMPHIPNVLAVWGTPIKVIGTDEDPLIPVAHVHWTASLTGTAAHIYEDMGHGMMLESGWPRVAEDIAAWLQDNGFGG